VLPARALVLKGNPAAQRVPSEVEILATLSGLASQATGKPAKLTSFAIYNLARNNEFRSDKAKRELGYRPRPFADTIADTTAWLKADRCTPCVDPPFLNNSTLSIIFS
jgi:dihydroflavonol-4-reductase